MTGKILRPAVFFDRDGVLNEDTGYTHRVQDFVWMPGAPQAIHLLNRRGWLVFVVTNQSGVARGYYEEAAVHVLHAHMNADLAPLGAHIDDFRHCPHHPKAAVEAYRAICSCRKPEPGMILDLLAAWPVDIGRSFLVGDRQSDLDAAEVAGLPGYLYHGGDLESFVAELVK